MRRNGGKVELMPNIQQVIEQIQDAFRETEHPGDAFLQGSQEGVSRLR